MNCQDKFMEILEWRLQMIVLFEKIFIVLLFLVSLDFVGLSTFWLLLLFVLSFLKFFVKKQKVTLNLETLSLLLFSFFYTVILNSHIEVAKGLNFLLFFGPIFSHFSGRIHFRNTNVLIVVVVTIAFGNFLHGFLNMLVYFRLYGLTPLLDGMRFIPQIWTERYLVATLQGSFFALVGGLLFYAIILFVEKKVLHSMFIILMILFSVFSSLIMGNRTFFLILALSIIISGVYAVFFFRIGIRKFLKLTYLFLLPLIFITPLFIFNAFGLQEFILESTLYIRLQSMNFLEDPRLQVYIRVFEQFIYYPFGGFKMNFGLKYAHNLWIDVLHSTGWIPFFFLLIYSFKALINIHKAIFINIADESSKYLLIGVSISFLITFTFEPVLDGIPIMFMSFCIINGMISNQIDHNLNRVSEE